MPSPKSRRSKTPLQSSKASKTREGSEIFAIDREGRNQAPIKRDLALARLETALDLVDHVNPALAADQTVVAVAATQRFQ
jgi:hypothetical protein